MTPPDSLYGVVALATFVVAYIFVATEEFSGIRKSKPVLLAAGIIWTLLGLRHLVSGGTGVEDSYNRVFLEFAELFVFLIVAMTFINAMAERNVFEVLRARILAARLGFRSVFWVTGTLAFFISPIADNLTTSLLMAAVVIAVGQGNKTFVRLGCVNIVVAANAGGAFSPFGDITTLMVWQRGVVGFWEFFNLVLPSATHFVVPAAIMHFAVPAGRPEAIQEKVEFKQGALFTVFLFLLTIAVTVVAHHVFNLPAVFGMLFGLSFLQLFGFYLRRLEERRNSEGELGDVTAFDVFRHIAHAEWDTLFFFYGVMACVGGIAAFGYLDQASAALYGTLGTTAANVCVGVLSAIIDNIPVMYAVLEMQPEMGVDQWLLVTLTVGVGGSLLSIGSAAGVALMGQARGVYTFFSHVRWSWAIALGYAASILVHMWLSFPS